MQKLGLLDQLMFKMEEGGMSPMHMCAGMIVDTVDSPHPVDGEVLADHMAACMAEIPLMRQRLIQDPLKLGDLRLVEDPDFDVRDHIARSTLPGEGNYDQLTEALGTFSSAGMDLTRPLWRCEVIDGLGDGQIAVAIHIHHAILDGTGAMRALGGIWSQRPTAGGKPNRTRERAGAVPSPLALMSDAILENMHRLYIQTPRFVLNNAAPLAHTLVKQLSKGDSAPEPSGDEQHNKPWKVHKTSLNCAPISNLRAVSYAELPLTDIKFLRRSLDCSINDLVLLLSSYALQHYFKGVGEQIDFDLVAGMPIDLRPEGDTTAGNSVAVSRVNLHNTVQGIRPRLKAIVAETTAIKGSAKSSKSREQPAQGIDYKALGGLFSPLLLDAAVYGITRFNLMDKATLVNVSIANVPGPQSPVYLAGARLHSQIPMGPCTDGLALNITVSSTDRYLVFGFHGCARAIQDKELLVEGVSEAFKSLGKASAQRRKTGRGQNGKKSKPRQKAKASSGDKSKAGR